MLVVKETQKMNKNKKAKIEMDLQLHELGEFIFFRVNCHVQVGIIVVQAKISTTRVGCAMEPLAYQNWSIPDASHY
jgi:hypothetical protein